MTIRTSAKTQKHIFSLQGLGRFSAIGSFIVLRADGHTLTLPFCQLTLKNNNVSLGEVDWIMSDIMYYKFLLYLYPQTFAEMSQTDFTNMCDKIVYFEK